MKQGSVLEQSFHIWVIPEAILFEGLPKYYRDYRLDNQTNYESNVWEYSLSFNSIMRQDLRLWSNIYISHDNFGKGRRRILTLLSLEWIWDILADRQAPAERCQSQAGKHNFFHYKIFHSLGNYISVLFLQISPYVQKFVFSRSQAIHSLSLMI